MSTSRVQPSPVPAGPGGRARSDRWSIAAPGFRRLLGVRFAAQWGDGMFQAALGGAVLFNPERAADPLAVAAGLAVILLPYSLVGPFAGALLDRWDRRRVLLVANLLRAVLILAVAVVVSAGVAGVPLYLAALVASLFAGHITKKCGRRVSMLGGGAIFLLGAILNGLAKNVAMLIVGRIFLGIGVGFSNQVTIYL